MRKAGRNFEGRYCNTTMCDKPHPLRDGGVADQYLRVTITSLMPSLESPKPTRPSLSVVRGGLNGSTQHFILNEEMECMQMTRRNGRGFSSAEKTELWDRWQRGESLKAIGRVFGKPSSSIYFQLSPHGGIRPSPRRRSRLALSLWEREEISRGIVARHSIRSMALLLSRSPSTVSREVRRNGGYDQYRAALADDMAWARARRPKRCKLALSSGMRRVVAMKLGLNWSPEQIAGWLKRAHPGAGSYQVSHETIYPLCQHH